jgi:hypothetical protein
MQGSVPAELDLAPFKVADLDRPQTMPIRDQDQGCIAMAISTGASRLNEPIDFSRR